MYTWTITTRTKNQLSREHQNELETMISHLLLSYETCEEKEQDFRQVFTLLNAFRDIIMSWPLYEFSAAYDELAEWQSAFMGGF